MTDEDREHRAAVLDGMPLRLIPAGRIGPARKNDVVRLVAPYL